MSQRMESIALTSHLMTFIIEQRRLIAGFLRSSFGLTFNEFAVLFALACALRPVTVEELGDYLMLKRRTVLSILAALEDRMLVAKRDAGEDNRKMLVSLSDQGWLFARAAIGQVDDMNRSTLWGSLPIGDFRQVMRGSIRPSVDGLRGHAAPASFPPLDGQTDLQVDFLIFWSVLVEKWADVAQRQGRLSLGEYRILALLAETGRLGQQAVGHRLIMQKSKVSLYKDRLRGRQLLVERESARDGRANVLDASAAGRRMVVKCGERMGRVLDLAHSPLSDDHLLVVEAWYARMYGNLMKAQNRTV